MNEYKILIPMADNDQKPFSEHTISTILESALAMFGGYTFGPVLIGAWRDDNGKVVYDSIRPLYVCTDSAEPTAWVEGLAITLDQTCIYMAQVSNSVQFIYKK